MLDATDMRILDILAENARMPWSDIGKKVHMTGQAVSARIKRMEELGVIEGFTVKLNLAKMGKSLHCYLTVYMKTNNHAAFLDLVKSREEVLEAHKTSGGGCYLVKAAFPSNESLNTFLDEILRYGNYGLSVSLHRYK